MTPNPDFKSTLNISETVQDKDTWYISILLYFKLTSFATVIHNASVAARRQRLLTNSGVIQYLNQLVL